MRKQDKNEPSEFNAAFELLKQWMDISEADAKKPLGDAAIYTTSVVLWLMLFQRLKPGSSLKIAVEHFIANAPKGAKTDEWFQPQ